MTDEINITLNMSVRNGEFVFSQNESLLIDQLTSGGGNPGTVEATITDTAVDLGDVTDQGYMWIKNLDPDPDSGAYIQWGPDKGGSVMQPIGKLLPGEASLLRLDPTSTLMIKCNTGTVKAYVAVLWS